MNRTRVLLVTALVGLAACATPPTRPVPPETQLPVPVLEKTFGNIQTDSGGALLIEYKTMHILVDPAASTTWDTAKVDYLLLTDAAPRPLNARKDLKIMAPPSAVGWLQKQGFTQVKGASSGQRVYLKKDDAFLFANAVTSGVNEQMRNSYLLEFDNGRNIFVSGRLASLDTLREFVFSLRDDGKDIHAAIMAADTDATGAEAIGLLQPQFAFYDAGDRPADRKTMDKMLAEQLYPGTFSLLKRGQSVPF
jgi:hypothetical protein